jgi:hypothetical protein
MLRLKAIAASALVAHGLSFGASAAEIGHFNGGFLNIRDYFVPADPGFYGLVYNYFYTTNRVNDDHGDEISSGVVTVNPGPGPGLTIPVDIDVDLDLYALSPVLLWVSDWNVLGARYAAFVAPLFANASVQAQLSIGQRFGGEADNTSFDVGDMLVQPLWLGWTSKHLDVTAGYGFYAATGKYDTETRFLLGNPIEIEDPDNIGYGFWTHQGQAAVAVYPFDHKGTAVTAVATYEYHGEKEDFDIQPGQNLTLNWGISQYLPLTSDQHLLLEIGPAGWNGWQLSSDEGSDVRNTDRDRTFGVGGQIGLTYVPWSLVLNAHGFYEYSTHDRFQGSSAGVSLAKKFF